MAHQPKDPDFRRRVELSFARQRVMQTLGIQITRLDPGEIELSMPYAQAYTQQHGFVHAGAIASIADSACGYAAATLLDKDAGVLAVEFKINLLAPGAGDYLIARGRVIRAGRTLTVCQADVSAVTGSSEKAAAVMTATIMNVRGREGVVG